VLVGIRIKIALAQRDIGLDKIVELDDLNGQTVLRRHFFGDLHDFRLRAGCHADLDGISHRRLRRFPGIRFFGFAAAAGQNKGEQCRRRNVC